MKTFRTLKSNDRIVIVYKDFKKIDIEIVASPYIEDINNDRAICWTLKYMSMDALKPFSVENFKESSINLTKREFLDTDLLYFSDSVGIPHFRYDIIHYDSSPYNYLLMDSVREYEDVYAIFIYESQQQALSYISKFFTEQRRTYAEQDKILTRLKESMYFLENEKPQHDVRQYPNAQDSSRVNIGDTVVYIPDDIVKEDVSFYKVIKKDKDGIVGLRYGASENDMSSYIFFWQHINIGQETLVPIIQLNGNLVHKKDDDEIEKILERQKEETIDNLRNQIGILEEIIANAQKDNKELYDNYIKTYNIFIEL